MENGKSREIELQQRTLPILQQAQQLVILTREDCDLAAGILQVSKALLAESDSVFGPVIKAAHDSHKAALLAKKRVDEPLLQIQVILRPKVTVFFAEEAHRRREAEALARKAAVTALLEEAVALEAAGDQETAQVVLEAAPTLAIRPIPTYRPEGVSKQESWNFEITNVNLIPREYLIPDQQKIGAVVRALKDRTEIPGVRIWRAAGIAVRRA